MSQRREPLRVAGFRPLAASYAINELGDNLGVVALAILVLDETGSALATAALFLVGKFLPALVAPALTAATDRRPVRQVLPVLYAAEAGAFAALALVAGAFSLPLVLALAFCDGALALTARGLSRGAVHAVLAPAGALREGNALLNVAFAVTSAAGPAAAGLLVGASGVATALWLDAASFAAIALMLAVSSSLPAAPPAAAGDASGPAWRARLREGVAYVRGHRLVGALVLGEGVALVFFTLIVPIEVVYAKETLDAGDAGFGLLLTAWGAGIVLGSAVFARAGDRPLAVLVVGSTAAIAAGYAGLALAPTLAVACAASVVGGIGNGVQWVAVLTEVQEAVAADMQARVVGLLESLAAAAPGIGYVAGGALAALWSPRAAYAVAAVGILAVLPLLGRRPTGGPG